MGTHPSQFNTSRYQFRLNRNMFRYQLRSLAVVGRASNEGRSAIECLPANGSPVSLLRSQRDEPRIAGIIIANQYA